MARLPYLLLPLLGFALLRAQDSLTLSDAGPILMPPSDSAGGPGPAPGAFRLPPSDDPERLQFAPGTFDPPAPRAFGLLGHPFPPGLPGILPASPDEAEKAHRDSVIAHFPEYWAKVEQVAGWDGELDWRRLYGEGGPGMRLRGPSDAYVRMDPATGPSFDLTAIGRALAGGWRDRTSERGRTERFRKRAAALIGLARGLEAGERKNAIGVSFIVARLGFMAKRVAEGKLPPRPDRVRMASDLKAWAGHPEFASTALGPSLARLCSLYVDYAEYR